MTAIKGETGRSASGRPHLGVENVSAPWASAFAAVPRARFLPDLMWPFDLSRQTSVPVSRAEDPAAWREFAAADVPMLPVVAPTHAVARQILAYAVVTVASSLLLWPVAGTGVLYPVLATVLGAFFVGAAARLLVRSRTSDDLTVLQPMRLFHLSNLYLSLLFLAVALVPFAG